jgi:outer membrane protein assembly factor BamB
MVALNGYTGGFIWLSAAGTSIYGQPTLTSEGILYHTNFGGELIALNSSTGMRIYMLEWV